MQGQIVRVLLVSVGYACFLAMNSFSLWDFALLPQQTLGEQASSYWRTALSLVNAFAFLAFAVWSLLRPKTFSKAVFPTAAGFMAATLLLVGLFHLTGSVGFAACAGACMGVATTACFFCWVGVYASEGVDLAQVEIVAGSVLSAIPFAIFLTLDRSAIAATLMVLAVLTLAFLYQYRRTSPMRGIWPDAAETKACVPAVIGGTWRVCLCCVVMGIMASVAVVLGSSMFAGLDFVKHSLMVHSQNFVAAIVVSVMWFAFRRKPDMTRTFMVLFPVLATAFLAFLIVPSARAAVPYLGAVAFVICSMVVFIESIVLSKERGWNLGFVYGLCAGVLYVSNALASLVMGKIGGSALGETSMMAAVVVLLYGFSIALYFITRRPEAAAASAWENVQTSAATVADEAFAATPEEASPVDPIDATARAVGEQAGLTERQIEVLALLARGYTIPAAASALYLSENTVRTHSKRIYAALGIHSKQELIELVADRAS